MARLSAAQLKELGLGPGLPRHVGIIMDGNGRYAKARGLPRSAGHRAGVERLSGIVRLSSNLGIEALTLYAFSTENWSRPPAELEVLFGLFVEYLSRQLAEMDENGVRLGIIGDFSKFPERVRAAGEAAVQKTANNTGIRLNIALNYGARAEVTEAARRLVRLAAEGSLRPEDVSWEELANGLYTHGLPDPDLIIRTSGEQRLSGFLLLQAAYAELVFVKEHWPEFSDERYIAALAEYQRRSRRFGGL